ncbi:MAG: sporulation protein [Fibrobacterota bacterium]|nr:sporulation protein [Fibrobacterota bacterium]QQS03627.1 MAG: sporulation protein [Fibrobacterota bacterium]
MSVAETLDTVLDKVRSLVQAESVVGKPISAPDGTIIVPVCRVTVGFGGGGGSQNGKESVGTGAGAVVTPVAFLVLRPDRTDLIPLDRDSWQFGKLMDFVPDLVEKFRKKPAAEKTPE